MTIETDEQTELNVARFKQAKQQANTLGAQLAAFQGNFDTLRADVDAASKTILDNKHAAFVTQVKSILGIT